MNETVRYEVDGSVATITIARPEKRNAMDLSVFDGLREAGERAGRDDAVRAVVVTGDGGTFSSGIDTTLFTSGGGDPAGIDIARLQSSFSIYEQISQPTIAAVQGVAFGGGFQLAIACDLRVVASDARLSVMETRWGIIPDLGATRRLPPLVGLGRAKELAFSAREVGAEEALNIGLANRVASPDDCLEEARAWARELAAGPPLALAGIKRLMGEWADGSVQTRLMMEASVQRNILRSRDFFEAIAARVEKRAPEFQKR